MQRLVVTSQHANHCSPGHGRRRRDGQSQVLQGFTEDAPLTQRLGRHSRPCSQYMRNILQNATVFVKECYISLLSIGKLSLSLHADLRLQMFG